jgi:lipopolysaccharide/colanic/teichoic acid biosynthesis glycosyltransferase
MIPLLDFSDMNRQWWYRLMCICGVSGITMFAMLVATSQLLLDLAAGIPIVGRLAGASVVDTRMFLQVGVATTTLLLMSAPLIQYQTRRLLDTIVLSQRRVVISGFLIATIGYFDRTLALPRLTLLLLIAQLLIFMPVFFVVLSSWAKASDDAVLLVGQKESLLRQATQSAQLNIVGYVAPSEYKSLQAGGSPQKESGLADGGKIIRPESLEYLGGVSSLAELIINTGATKVIFAYDESNLSEFFGGLRICLSLGVEAMTLQSSSESVLKSEDVSSKLVDVNLKPWGLTTVISKRMFDILFSSVGLLLLSPAFLMITIIIKVRSGETPIFWQERSTTLGGRCQIPKFRSMSTQTPPNSVPKLDEENDRVTAVGRIIRPTHMDELPQLWSILMGHMSVVGPRPAWTQEERHLEKQVDNWSKRWFVKPGLTGLAQINSVSSLNPESKLLHDLEYIREQSMTLDVKIVARQLWGVVKDVLSVLNSQMRY